MNLILNLILQDQQIHHQIDTNPTKTARFKKTKRLRDDDADISLDPDGETAKSGPNPDISSGFGGLGFEGMVGMEDPVGEGNLPPGEGKRGEISGESFVNGEERGFANSAGAAERVVGGEEREGKAMKAIMSDDRNQKEAIQMMVWNQASPVMRCAMICVCVCVCVCEREREREGRHD
ncbi:hypothetical protein CEY00_Acc04338 [Actinidia chinensis var. chinensis]|uniref:Uncharacterized protein n=1 Tax=Actinidia chinensis var. chinensis TaxID=1590841 RepID=A0A2R6RVA9_ACTCC|nr:hypothetical protein CEY00_Acc04338 [Actinidia chinensis var. chinensis]